MSILNYSAFCFCLWIYSKTRKKSCRMSNDSRNMPRVQGSISYLQNNYSRCFSILEPVSHHCPVQHPPSTHDESEDLQTMVRRMVWMQHVAYMSTFLKFFYWTDRTKIYSPHLMNVGEQHFFSSANFYQRNLCSPIGTHNFKLSLFYWHSLIFLEMTNCDQTD